MIKIIKYSIALIIFSIIISLFTLYFYILKGISVENIHLQNINIGKLYIKIDKKIIFKAKNIYIISKNKENSKKEDINFKKQLKLLKKGLHYLAYFQDIEIKNLNINNNKLNYISLKENNLVIDTPDIFLKSKISYDKKYIYVNSKDIDIKKFDIIIKHMYMKLSATSNSLYLLLKTDYNYSQIQTNIRITNKNIYYDGNIYNITKRTFKKFEKYLKDINNISIYSINFKGDKNNINLDINNINTKVKQFPIHSKKLTLEFNFLTNKLKANDNAINIKVKNNNINILNTLVYFDVNKTKALIENETIAIENNNTNIVSINNTIKYTPKLTTFNSETLNITYDKINAYIKELEVAYTEKNAFVYSDVIHLHNNELNGDIYNNNINYNLSTQNITITNRKANINYLDNSINAKDLESDYNIKTQILNSNIKILNIINKDIKALIYNSSIQFNKKTNNAFIKNQKANIQYKTIKNIKLNNIETSFVKNILNTSIPTIDIDNIKINNTKLNLNNNILTVLFKTKTLLSQKLNKILSVFGINISIYQKTGKNNIDAKIVYNLKKDKLNTNLKIAVDKSRLMLTKTTYLDISHSDLNLIDSNITLKNTTLDYNQSIVNLTYKIDKGLINLNKSYISTNGKFEDLNLTNIVEIKNYPENLYIDLNTIDIKLQNLQTDILIDDNITVTIDKLSKFYPYISYLKQYNINDGKIKVDIGDVIDINANITDTNQTILAKKLKYLKKLDLNTTINDKNITISNKNLNIKLYMDENTTIVNGGYKNLDLNITQFVDQNNSSESNTTTFANLKAANTNIIYNDLKLYSSKLSIDYNTTNAKVVSLYKDRNITVLYGNNGFLKLYGLNIRGKTFKDLTNTNILNDPLIDIFAIRNKDSEILNGFIDIKKGYIKELKAFTNVLAFINLIPSLVTFQATGFTAKGYKIKHGYIEYILYNNKLFIKDINIKGENLTFDGKGYIDLKKKTIDLNVNVNLLIKLIKDIPIVNYILLGEDGGITLNLSITGDLADPTISKNAISNILGGPLDIIKRAILTPFRPFMKDNNE